MIPLTDVINWSYGTPKNNLTNEFQGGLGPLYLQGPTITPLTKLPYKNPYK